MKRVIGVIVLLASLAFAVFLLISPRDKRGSEFCPQTFEVRTFVYQANAFRNFNMNRDLPASIAGSSITKHLKPFDASVMAKQWDLVEGIDLESKVGNAQILKQYLESTSASSAWKLDDWSGKHPELAAELWPRVQELAVHNMYFAIPDLIEYALKKPSVPELIAFADQKKLDAIYHQLSYLLSLKPTKDNRIRLLRLVTWAESWLSSTGKADLQRYSLVSVKLDLAKTELTSVVDEPLSTEELPKVTAAKAAQ